jgi:ElaB/YqjD/DUF883 family membrane-anchored ribosome-binding protein
MTMKDEFQDIKDEARDKLSADVAELKTSFAKLRGDVMTLLSDAMGAGKDVSRTGAAVATGQVRDKVDDLKERGEEQMEALSHKIEDNPVTAALIALGVGFIVAKLLTRK